MAARQSAPVTLRAARKAGTSNPAPGYYADEARHLVCVPYSRANLLAMAATLGIGKHWLHTGRLMHVDVPQRSVQRVLADPRVQVVSTRQVLAIIRAGQ